MFTCAGVLEVHGVGVVWQRGGDSRGWAIGGRLSEVGVELEDLQRCLPTPTIL